MRVRATVLMGAVSAPILLSTLVGGCAASNEAPGTNSEQVVTSASDPASRHVMAAPHTDRATHIVGKWSMKVSGHHTRNLAGGPAMRFVGSWEQVSGRVGKAIRFTAAPSYGVVPDVRGANPRRANFAMGEVFTSKHIRRNYSGNLMQKGLYTSPGQIKLQLIAANHGSVSCRIKGDRGAKTLGSNVVVDDRQWHRAICWRQGSRVGLTVDGRTQSTTWKPGPITNKGLLRMGNKASDATWMDQHFGAVDCAVYVLGAHARSSAADNLPC